MTYLTLGAATVLILCTTSCASGDPSGPRQYAHRAPPMEPTRTVSEHDCRQNFDFDGGNLYCIR